MPIRHLSVLDQSPIPSGSNAQQALRDSVALARIAEGLGYHRYWVAEHHGSASFAGCSPEILIGHIADATSRIRVGSAGVMLMHYSPLKVAENFKLLEALHPGRIDLGIGRAPGCDAVTAAALAYGSPVGIEYFPAKTADLQAFLSGEKPLTEGLEKVVVAPAVENPPELWMLGSSEDGARLAAHFGLPFAYAHFIDPDQMRRACDVYRRKFRPSERVPQPVVCLAVFALCADTEEVASRLGRCRDLWGVRVHRGEFTAFPSIQEAEEYAFSTDEAAYIAERNGKQILGTRDQVAQRLVELTEQAGAEELAVVSITHDFEARVRSYELLATIDWAGAPDGQSPKG